MIQVIGNDLFQWDLGRSVCYTPDEGVEINELHFAHQGDAKALVMEVVAEDGAYTAEIPNILLQSGKPIRVWAVCTAANARHNVELRILPVSKREKPTDYVYTQTEVKNYDSLTERIEKLEQGGNGGANTLVVSVTNEVADHKPAEIYSHVQHGGMAVLLYSDIIFGMTRATERHIEFSSATDENLFDCIKVNEDGSIERYEHFFVSQELFQREIEKAVRSVNNVTPDKNGNVDISNRLTVFSDAGNIATSNASEIAEHIANGGDAIYVDGNNFVYPLVGCMPDYAIFEHYCDDRIIFRAEIYQDGSVTFAERTNASEEYVNAKLEKHKPVVFNITYENEVTAYSHTIDELWEAYLSGCVISCSCFYRAGIYRLKTASETEFVFEQMKADENGYSYATITYNGTSESLSVFTEDRVPEWAMAPEKPAYTATEVGALPDTTPIPTDAHINSLIDAKLGVIENGTY